MWNKLAHTITATYRWMKIPFDIIAVYIKDKRRIAKYRALQRWLKK